METTKATCTVQIAKQYPDGIYHEPCGRAASYTHNYTGKTYCGQHAKPLSIRMNVTRIGR